MDSKKTAQQNGTYFEQSIIWLDSSNSITNTNNIAPIDDKLNTHLDDYEVFDEYDENIEPAPTGTPAINEEKK